MPADVTSPATAAEPTVAAPRPPAARSAAPTGVRILDAALASFAAKGYEATSLDSLAGELGVTKQTILHHFGSKERLLGAVLQRTVDDVAAVIDESLDRAAGSGWTALEAVVRAVFGLAGRRPELLGFLREVGRLGTPHNTRLVEELEPLTSRATAFLSAGMADAADARRIVVAAYAALIGAVTEVEVLRQLGEQPSARLLVRRRRELLQYLSDLLGLGQRTPSAPGTGGAPMPRRPSP